MTQQDLIDEEDLKVYTFDILGTRCFSSMFPSMPKGEIVSMNANAMGQYYRSLTLTVFVIDDNIVISNRVADYD